MSLPKKIIIALLLLLFTVIIASFVISNLIENKVTEALLNNNSKYSTTTVGDVNFNLLSGSISLKNIDINPTNEVITELKEKRAEKDSYQKISISSINLKGMQMLEFLSNNKVAINELEVNNILLHKIVNEEYKLEEEESKSFNVDSIFIEKIEGLQIDKISINNLKYEIEDVAKNKLVFDTQPLDLEINGIKLEKHGEHLFKLRSVEKFFEINDIEIDFPEKSYIFSVETVAFDFENKIINIENFKYKPTKDKFELAKTYKYNTSVFSIDIEKLSLFNFDILKAISKEGVFIDSINISGANIDLYKDKRKPYEPIDKKLPHVVLKQMKSPLYIKKINIEKSDFLLEGSYPKSSELLKLTLNDINAEIENISSIKEFRDHPMLVNLNTKLMNKSMVKAKIIFPMEDDKTTFKFSGSLASSKLTYFDSAIFPILGLKILKGNLDQLTFNASANNYSSTGTMTLLYHDLDATVFKPKNKNEKSNVLSWTVNQVLHKSNPGKNKKVRKVPLNYNRIPKHGFGSYVWKTLQSGVTRTLAPEASKAADKLLEKKKKRASKKQKKGKK